MVFATTLAAERLDLYKQVYADEPDWVDEEQIEWSVPESEEELSDLMDYLRQFDLLSDDAQ